MPMTSNAGDAADDFRAQGAAMAVAARKLVVTYGAVLQGNVKRHAQGRPGPMQKSGNLQGNIFRQTPPTVRGVTTTTVSVGPGAPQAWRLEMGFVGADSLGRVFSQPAYPFMGPGFDDTVPLFLAAVEGLVSGA
jgi:hypothetical protein